MTLYDNYIKYARSDMYPFHMPGHKRNTELMHMMNPYMFDSTEITDLDDLHNPDDKAGWIQDSEKLAAELFHSRYSFYTVNGSTGALIASVLALSKPHQKVLVARNCHISIYNAIALAQLDPIYLWPKMDRDGICASIQPEQIQQAFQEHPDIALVILVSPTYEGVLSDISGIADIVHSHNAKLLIDEAHGAHLALDHRFPKSAIETGADVVVQSLHKTLPCLTQTAILHVCSDRMDPNTIRRMIAVEETSSPSYVLVCSCDQCIHLMKDHGRELFDAYWQRLTGFDQEMKSLQHLHILCHGSDAKENHPGFYDFDPGKILISTRGTDLTGPKLAEILRNTYHLETEYTRMDAVLAMTSVADTREGFHRLEKALLEIDAELKAQEDHQNPISQPDTITTGTQSPWQAMEKEAVNAEPDKAIGRIAREAVFAYPPGIPILVPGEVITKEQLSYLKKMQKAGLQVVSASHGFPHHLEVCR